MLTLFESRYTLKERYNIGNVGKTACMSMSMLTLFESRYTLKGRYNIGNVGQTASMLLFESRLINQLPESFCSMQICKIKVRRLFVNAYFFVFSLK